MNSPLILLIAVAAGLILFEIVTRTSRRSQPSRYTLATHYAAGTYETAAYYAGRHVCTAVHICGTASRAQALASARQHVLTAHRLPC